MDRGEGVQKPKKFCGRHTSIAPNGNCDRDRAVIIEKCFRLAPDQSHPSSAVPPITELAAPSPASSYLPNMAEIESALWRGKKEHALFKDIEIDVVSIDDEIG